MDDNRPMINLGVVMDPIESIKVKKDSTFAMLLEAQARGWQIYYMQMVDLCLKDGQPYADMQRITVTDRTEQWFDVLETKHCPLSTLDVVLMRKDPPVDNDYYYATHILELAERAGTLVVNKPRSLRDANEKLFTAWFGQCTPATLVSRKHADLVEFVSQQKDVIIKPLDAMGGASIYRIRESDPNMNVIIETITAYQQHYVMAQRFIPEIRHGDKRILIIGGEPVPYALARIPAKGETRGNLAVGGTGVGVELNQRDRWICQQVAPTLIEKGLLFVGLDVIGDYLTEINVTSPTCIRELDSIYGLNISGLLMDVIEKQLQNVG